MEMEKVRKMGGRRQGGRGHAILLGRPIIAITAPLRPSSMYAPVAYANALGGRLWDAMGRAATSGRNR